MSTLHNFVVPSTFTGTNGSGRRTTALQAAWAYALAEIRLHPVLFDRLVRLRTALPYSPTYRIVTPDTELVVEGYFRSANTYTVNAIQKAQERPVRIAHHTHAAATVKAALARGLPTLLLARPPADAISGRLLLHPHVPLGVAIREYVRFYDEIHPLRRGFVPATFAEVTADIDAVIAKVNGRFGTAFRGFGPDVLASLTVPRARTADLPRFASRPRSQYEEYRAAVRDEVRRHQLFDRAEAVFIRHRQMC